MPLRTVLIFAIALGAGFADASSLRTSHDDLRDRLMLMLGRHPRISSAEPVIARLDPRVEDGLLVAGRASSRDLAFARRLARTLLLQHGYRLFLIQDYDGENVPVFDGLLLDKANTIVANVVLRHWETARELPLTDPDRRMPKSIYERFRLHPWIGSVFKEERVEPANADEAIARHAPQIALVAEMAATFGVGTDRPTWILFDAPAEDRAPAAYLQGATELTLRYERLPVSMMALRDKLVTIIGPRVRIEPLLPDVDLIESAAWRADEARALAEALIRGARADLRAGLVPDPFAAPSAPGLIVSGYPAALKRRDARRLGQILFERHGLTLFLFSDAAGRDAPGLDGVIMDREHRGIANFAYAKLPIYGAAGILKTTAERAAAFADLPAWIEDGALTISQTTHEKMAWAPRKRVQFLGRSSRLLDIGADRPTWIVAFSGEDQDIDRAVGIEAARLTTEPAGPAVILIVRPRKLLTVHAGRHHEEPLAPCVEDLTGDVAPDA